MRAFYPTMVRKPAYICKNLFTFGIDISLKKYYNKGVISDKEVIYEEKAFGPGDAFP